MPSSGGGLHDRSPIGFRVKMLPMPSLSDSYLSPLVSVRRFWDERALNQQQGRNALRCLLSPLI